MTRLLAVAATRTAGLMNARAMAADLRVDHKTVVAHTELLENLFLVRRLLSWHANLGSRQIKAPKLHVADTGLLTHLLRADARRIEDDAQLAGPIFETFVAMELERQSEWSESKPALLHYRDKQQREVDMSARASRRRRRRSRGQERPDDQVSRLRRPPLPARPPRRPFQGRRSALHRRANASVRRAAEGRALVRVVGAVGMGKPSESRRIPNHTARYSESAGPPTPNCHRPAPIRTLDQLDQPWHDGPVSESVTIHEAKTHFSKLVRRAEAGEEIVVRRGRDPVARIAPLERKHGGVTGRGSMKGEIWMVSDEEMKKVDEEIADNVRAERHFPRRKGSAGQSLRLLIDSHALLWHVLDDSRLGPIPTEAIEATDAEVARQHREPLGDRDQVRARQAECAGRPPRARASPRLRAAADHGRARLARAGVAAPSRRSVRPRADRPSADRLPADRDRRPGVRRLRRHRDLGLTEPSAQTRAPCTCADCGRRRHVPEALRGPALSATTTLVRKRPLHAPALVGERPGVRFAAGGAAAGVLDQAELVQAGEQL